MDFEQQKSSLQYLRKNRFPTPPTETICKKSCTYSKYVLYKLKKFQIFTMQINEEERKMSEKMEKFERLAERRVNEAIKKIRLIGNLANKNNYEYSENHSRKIIEALESELKILKSKFKDEESEGGMFTFGSK